MDKEWLESELAAGRSIESIAREIALDPSSVAYWVAKHDLASQHADRHRARGGIQRETLADLVARDLTVREIAVETGRSYTTVRYWLMRHGLETTAEARRGNRATTKRRHGHREKHGEVELVRYRDGVL